MNPNPNRFTPGRYLQARYRSKGVPTSAIPFVESQNWTDRAPIVGALKSSTEAYGPGDFPGAFIAIADAFMLAMRPYSVPFALMQFLRKVPMRTRLYIHTGVTAARVAEGGQIPVLKGNWAETTLTPKKFAGISVQTDELMESTAPTAAAAITDDLALATAEAENLSFVSPYQTGSVLDGAPNFAGTGNSIAQIDADLAQLVGLVPGASRPGASFVMTQESATYLSLLHGTSGAVAYPDVTVQGGQLQGLPVIVTSACQEAGSPVTRIVGLLSPSEIFWADEGRIELSTSKQAALEMDDAPAATGNLTSLWQANSTATKAIRESSWYARAGAGAYFVAAF
jgi:hypothetical protein